MQISTMKKVAHPNCVILHEVYDEANKTYLVLDLITGGTVSLSDIKYSVSAWNSMIVWRCDLV